MKYLLALLFIFQAFTVAAQPGDYAAKFPVKGRQAIVTDWGSRSLYMSNTFFAETKDSIVAQIGQQEYDEMVKHCNLKGWPEGFYMPDLSEEDDKAFDERLNKLKMYKIAAYTHRYNGKTFDRYVLLRVPYTENKNWNLAVKWEGSIYFLIKEADTRVVK